MTQLRTTETGPHQSAGPERTTVKAAATPVREGLGGEHAGWGERPGSRECQSKCNVEHHLSGTAGISAIVSPARPSCKQQEDCGRTYWFVHKLDAVVEQCSVGAQRSVEAERGGWGDAVVGGSGVAQWLATARGVRTGVPDSEPG